MNWKHTFSALELPHSVTPTTKNRTKYRDKHTEHFATDICLEILQSFFDKHGSNAFSLIEYLLQ